MLIYSLSVSLDGFVKDREGSIDWSIPGDELFRFHIGQVSELGAHISGRRTYEGMLVWEDPEMRATPDRAEFAEVWCAIPKVVFSRTLESVEGNARLAERSLADEIPAVLESAEGDVAIAGADLGGQAFELGLVDELRLFRHPVLIGGGTPYLPPLAEAVPLELIETRAFDSGQIFERYAVSRSAAGRP